MLNHCATIKSLRQFRTCLRYYLLMKLLDSHLLVTCSVISLDAREGCWPSTLAATLKVLLRQPMKQALATFFFLIEGFKFCLKLHQRMKVKQLLVLRSLTTRFTKEARLVVSSFYRRIGDSATKTLTKDFSSGILQDYLVREFLWNFLGHKN